MTEKKVCLAPLKVSPLIKLMRWTCLIYGVVYGFKKRRMYAAMETARREKEEAERPAREAYLREEKLRRNTAELKELEDIFLGTSEKETKVENEVGTSMTEEIEILPEEMFPSTNELETELTFIEG